MQKVQDVKQRMRQMEMEMFKLRTTQLEMKKDGQPHVLTNSGKAILMIFNCSLKL